MENLDELKYYLDNFETAPTFGQMPRRTLRDKGSDGPTGAHFIEEIHSPYNLAYVSVTTGSTAFQNITGVTRNELNSRAEAGRMALELSGVRKSEKILITYPPLVNVFYKDALVGYDLSFLERSCRNALLWALCSGKPRAVIGESSFLRACIQDAIRLDLLDEIKGSTVFLAAGTPLDIELPSLADRYGLGEVHDLYGCQEFGWLTLDGRELRGDISLIPCDGKAGYFHLMAGGLPTGDCFPVVDGGHICGSGRAGHDGNPVDSTQCLPPVPCHDSTAKHGDIITYSRLRTKAEPEGTITHTTASSEDTVYRLAKTILRIKGKILRVSPNLVTNAGETRITYASAQGEPFEIKGPEKTMLFDALLDAQIEYQSQNKKDPAWAKDR